MKECPECKRTYADDTITFCLVDGSILSAPYDPQATLILPKPPDKEQLPTEPSPAITLPSTSPVIESPQTSEEAPARRTKGSPRWGLIIGFTVLLIVSVSIAFIIGYRVNNP